MYAVSILPTTLPEKTSIFFCFTLRPGNANELALQHSRAMALWIDTIDNESKTDPGRNLSNGAATEVTEYIWSFINFSQDSVRHNVRKLLWKIASFYKRTSQEKYYMLLRSILAMSWLRKEKFLAIATLTRNLGFDMCRDLQQLDDSLPRHVLDSFRDRTVASVSQEICSAFLAALHNRDNSAWWIKWIQPLLALDFESPEVFNMITRAMNMDTDVCDYVLNSEIWIGTWDLSTALLAISVKKRKESSWTDYVSFEKFQRSVTSYQDKVIKIFLPTLLQCRFLIHLSFASPNLIRSVWLRWNALFRPGVPPNRFLLLRRAF